MTTWYMLGAGVNRCMADLDGLKPPLARDFFQQALRHARLSEDWQLDRLRPLFEYIQQYWHLSLDQLRDRPFDLEECYTLLHLQRGEAAGRDDPAEAMRLARLEYLLSAALLEYLSGFFDWTAPGSGPLASLASVIRRDGASVISFNYDTLLEGAFQSASGVMQPPAGLHDDPDAPPDLGYSHSNWNPALAYGLRFDDVELPQAGVPRYVAGDAYYAHPANQLYDPPLLKLHGSINWFVHSGFPLAEGIPIDESRRGRTLIARARHSVSLPPMRDGEMLSPIIITPVLHKAMLRIPLLDSLWHTARARLPSCDRLIIIGYSFPPTDFHVRRLLRESFADRSLLELVVVNPDASVIDVARDLCNFRRAVRACPDLDTFLEGRSV